MVLLAGLRGVTDLCVYVCESVRAHCNPRAPHKAPDAWDRIHVNIFILVRCPASLLYFSGKTATLSTPDERS